MTPVDISHLPIDTRFSLGATITAEQEAFLEHHGFIVFAEVASPEEVQNILAEVDQIQSDWIAEERETVHGIPIFQGCDETGVPFIQRFPFTSCFSKAIHSFVRDERFEPVRRLIGEDARIGDEEKDGVVLNRYINVPGSVYPRLGWHTDGLRDLFYLRKPQRMLNVGLHFDRCTKESGGLRLLPGTHRQGFLSMCFKKPYFVWHRPDADEIAVETEPGDLTLHDGRLWHRVQSSPHTGEASLRRTMYVPYLTDAYQPKSAESGTPFYHHLGRWMRAFQRRKGARVQRRLKDGGNA